MNSVEKRCCDRNDFYFVERDQASSEPDDYRDCCSQKQVKRYESLIALLQNNENYKTSLTEQSHNLKGTLAFYIEANKQLSPEWQDVLNSVEQKIRNIWQENVNQTQSYKQTTWLLDELVSGIYQTVLFTQLSLPGKDGNAEHTKFLQRSLKHLETLQKLREMLKKQDKPIGIGGIHETFYPSWFFKHCCKTI